MNWGRGGRAENGGVSGGQSQWAVEASPCLLWDPGDKTPKRLPVPAPQRNPLHCWFQGVSEVRTATFSGEGRRGSEGWRISERERRPVVTSPWSKF